MYIILLSGGSGSRLWPLSNGIRSKQFIKIYKSGQARESMIQRIYRQIKEAGITDEDKIVITTRRDQVPAINNQLGNDVEICVEPCRRDTFPAIMLASAYMHDVLRVDDDEVVVVCPVDPYVGNEYFKSFRTLQDIVSIGVANIALLGIRPLHPSEKYGYIIPVTDEEISDVRDFKEKPELSIAKCYIEEQGALWNAGVFAFRMSYAMDTARRLTGMSRYEELCSSFESLRSVSFDCEVVEKERRIKVLRYDGIWNDMGTWNAVVKSMDEVTIGPAKIDKKCVDVHIINELDIPIVAMGLENVIISASPGGVLVTEKESCSRLKDVLDGESEDIRFADKSWGSFKVVDTDNDSLTMKITIQPGDHMHYHSHDNRDEVWIVVSGEGKVVVDDIEKFVTTGNVIEMKAGCRHTVIAKSLLRIIEVQIGRGIVDSDKRRYEWNETWNL